MRRIQWSLFVSVWIALLLAGCTGRGTIHIGYVSDLTGKNAGIGVQGRNGAEIAIREINAAGGVEGRMLDLMVRDSGENPEYLRKMDEEMITAKAVALTGHMASWEAMAAYPLIQEKQLVLFSPTTSTPELSNKKDYFFRLIPESVYQTLQLANYAIENNLLKAAIVYDLSNQAFTETYAKSFAKQFQKEGGSIVGELTFNQNENPDLKPLADQLRLMKPDVILIVASGLNTALLAQHIRITGWDVQIMTSNWAYTTELLQNGGQAINEIVLPSHFYNECSTPEFLAFKEAYSSSYGQPPTFAAAMSYETIRFLSMALTETHGKAEGLPNALVRVDHFRGLCEDIIMTDSGDVLRTIHLIRIKNGKFTLLREIPPVP
jgi:branched-chain amino acid transport system substrate-binding protein